MISNEDFQNLEIGDVVKLDQEYIRLHYSWRLLCPYASVTYAGAYSTRIRMRYVSRLYPQGHTISGYSIDRSVVLHKVRRLAE